MVIIINDAWFYFLMALISGKVGIFPPLAFLICKLYYFQDYIQNYKITNSGLPVARKVVLGPIYCPALLYKFVQSQY